jgi:hypothetical protein
LKTPAAREYTLNHCHGPGPVATRDSGRLIDIRRPVDIEAGNQIHPATAARCRALDCESGMTARGVRLHAAASMELQEISMNCEGIWKVEIYSPYGWERIATAFMKSGEYLAASANHYSVGTYTQDGDDVKISTEVTQHGDLRTVFGMKTADKMHVVSRCTLKQDELLGKSVAQGKEGHDIQIRLTRLDTFE